MANGKNEPIEFTRGDAKTLVQIHDKLDSIIEFIEEHAEDIKSNTRFRCRVVKVLLWIFTSSAGLGLLAAGAKAVGWLS